MIRIVSCGTNTTLDERGTVEGCFLMLERDDGGKLSVPLEAGSLESFIKFSGWVATQAADTTHVVTPPTYTEPPPEQASIFRLDEDMEGETGLEEEDEVSNSYLVGLGEL